MASDLVKTTKIEERLEDTKLRYKTYIRELQELKEAQDTLGLPLYLSINFCYRGRLYYDVKNMLLDPQTKIGKYLWEAWTPRDMLDSDVDQIAFAIMGELARINPNNAYAEFIKDPEGNIAKYREAVKGDYLQEVYAERVIQAYRNALEDVPNRSFLFKDYTNGGGIHFASGLTKEHKAMVVCNLSDTDTVYDPHGLLRDAFEAHTGVKDITRDDIKKAVSQGVTAGVSPTSAVYKIKEYFVEAHGHDIDITEQDYIDIITDVYGKTGLYFHEYNKMGNNLYDNQNTVLKFTTRNGFKSASIAYLAGQEVKLYYISTNTNRNSKGDLPTTTIHRNMPMHYVRKGKQMTPNTIGEHAKAKNKGWLANITHGAGDAVAIQVIAEAMIEHGVAGLLIHDNIATFGAAHQGLIMPVAKQEIEKSMEDTFFIDVFRQASEGRRLPEFSPANLLVNDVPDDFVLGDNFMQV